MYYWNLDIAYNYLEDRGSQRMIALNSFYCSLDFILNLNINNSIKLTQKQNTIFYTIFRVIIIWVIFKSC